MKAFHFDGPDGEDVREEEIPADRLEECKTARHDMIAAIADHDDQIADKFLNEQDPTLEELRAAIRRVTIALKMTPVFIGSAYKNKGVQLLLDGVNMYLPNPTEVQNIALDQNNKEEKVILSSEPKKPFVGLAFKLEDGRYGQLTYMRIYQGTVTKGDFIVNNSSNGKRIKVPRLVRMHSNEMNDIDTRDGGRHRRAVRRRVRVGRHVHERVDRLHDDVDARARGRDLAGHRAQGQGQRRELLEGPQPLHQGGSRPSA